MRADSAPYEFIAVYQGTDKQLEVPIDPGTMIPSKGNGAILQRVVVRFSQEGLGGTSTAMFNKFTVGIRTANIKLGAKGLPVDKIGAKTDLVLFEWSEVNTTEREASFALDVHGKFADDYLCSEERALRAAQKPKPKPDANDDQVKKAAAQSKDPKAVKAAKDAKTKEALRTAYDLNGADRVKLLLKDNRIRDMQLFDEQTGTEILYSFCDPRGVNWVEAEKVPDIGFGQAIEKTQDLEETHRQRLAELLMRSGTLKRFATPTQPLAYGLDDKNDPVDKTGHDHKREILISNDFHFSILITDSLYKLTEESNDRVHDGYTTLFDQDSRIALQVERSPGQICPQVTSPAFAYRIQKSDSPAVDVKATPVDVKADFREPCVFTLAMNLKDYLDKTVSLTVFYKLHVIAGASRNVNEVPLFTTTFRVAHIGIVASLPVASEIYAVATSKSPSDINATSSIPVSYAVRYRGDAEHRHNLAVTFPLRVGFNTRWAPDLAKTISAFAHISFVFPVDTPATPIPSFGFGVSVLQALHISWAFDLDGGRYLFAGVSVTDIAKALKPNGK
jgi:hypothetical protein